MAPLRESPDGQASPFPRRTQPTVCVTGMPSAVKPFSASPWHNPGEPGEVTFVTHGVKIIRRFFGNPRKRTTGRGLIWTRAELSAHVSALYSDSSASFIAAFAVGLEPVATPSLTDHRRELVPCRPALRSGIAVWQELTAHGPRPANATACRSIAPPPATTAKEACCGVEASSRSQIPSARSSTPPFVPSSARLKPSSTSETQRQHP